MRPPSPLSRRSRRLHRVGRLVVLIALTAGSLTACVHRARVGSPDADDEGSAMPIPAFVYVAVENHNWGDVVISLVNSGGQRMRLGTVTAGATTTLRFPGSYIAGAQQLQLSAKAIGGRAAVFSERFTVIPGQQVTWTLESSLQRSSLAVY